MNPLRVAGRLAAKQSPSPALSGEHCVHYHDRAHTCSACADVCPVDAIELCAPPVLDQKRCERCLACLPVCPAGAITGEDEAPALFRYVAAVQPRRLELLCQHNDAAEAGVPGSEAAIRLQGCLAGLGSATLVLLAALGLEEIVVRDDACAGCPWQQAGPELALQVTEAQAVLALWGLAERLRLSEPSGPGWKTRPIHAVDAAPLSRRDLLGLRRSGSGQEIAPAGGNHPFRERLRLVQAMQMLGPPLPKAAAMPLPLRGFALLTAADSCTACGACARICPTGALTLAVDEEAYRLAFSPEACTDCQMCLHVCAPGALTRQPFPAYETVFAGPAALTLQEGAVALCQICRAPFPRATGSLYCAVCNLRRANPLGPPMTEPDGEPAG